MTPTVLYLAAFLLAGVDQVIARGRSLTTWAVILICVGLLWLVLAK